MRDFLKFSHFNSYKTDVFLQVFSWTPNVRPQNRCFMRGFRQFSAHVTEGRACHGICTLSHLTQPWQCDSQKTHNTTRLEVLRLPRKMNMDTSKVLHVPRKMKVIFWKRCKVLPLQDKTSFNMLWNMLDCHKVPRLPRQTRLRDVWTSKSDDFGRTHHIGMAIRSSRGRLPTVANGCGRLQTAADGCERLRNV